MAIFKRVFVRFVSIRLLFLITYAAITHSTKCAQVPTQAQQLIAYAKTIGTNTDINESINPFVMFAEDTFIEKCTLPLEGIAPTCAAFTQGGNYIGYSHNSVLYVYDVNTQKSLRIFRETMPAQIKNILRCSLRDRLFISGASETKYRSLEIIENEAYCILREPSFTFNESTRFHAHVPLAATLLKNDNTCSIEVVHIMTQKLILEHTSINQSWHNAQSIKWSDTVLTAENTNKEYHVKAFFHGELSTIILFWTNREECYYPVQGHSIALSNGKLMTERGPETLLRVAIWSKKPINIQPLTPEYTIVGSTPDKEQSAIITKNGVYILYNLKTHMCSYLLDTATSVCACDEQSGSLLHNHTIIRAQPPLLNGVRNSTICYYAIKGYLSDNYGNDFFSKHTMF